MQRQIIGYRKDEADDWVALLSCGHPQHVRHRPPFEKREWVTTEEGRRGMLGQMLNCVRCEELELPAHFVSFKKTPIFTAATIPEAFKREHATAPGIWGRITILEGLIKYHLLGLGRVFELSRSSTSGIIPPEVPHRIEPIGGVRFFLELFRAPEGLEQN